MIIYCKAKRYNVIKENCKQCKEVNFCTTIKELKAAEEFYSDMAEECTEDDKKVEYLNYL